MTPPVVSVVMAAYNGAAWLPATLASLGAQTFIEWEAVVVDDCSTDATYDVLCRWPDPRVRVIRAAANGGPVRARNLALSHARGRYIAGLDQDDLCRPERFDRQVAYLDRHADIVAVGSAAALLVDGVERPDSRAPHSTPALIGWLLLTGNPLIWSSMMVRGDAARALQPFTRPDRLYAEDFDLYHRLSAFGAIARLDEELMVYRCHAGGASQRFTTTMAGNAERVLAERYAPLLGDDEAADAARRVAAHVMEGDPVPDAETLARLGRDVGRLLKAYAAIAEPDPHSLELIRWEAARMWGRIGHKAVRSGHVSLRQLLAVRPDHMGLGYAGLDSLLVSGLIGTGRAARRRYGRTS